MKTEYVHSSGNLSGLLGVAFIVLKLCGVIHWSWLWVLAPFWIPLALAIGFVALSAAFAALVVLLIKK